MARLRFIKANPLAIDSGYYDNWRWGKHHNWNYWKRTIAHNSLLVYNPDEKRETWPPKFQQINDGGQRCAFVTHRPPHVGSGGHNYPKSIDDLKKRIDEFRMGNITNYDASDTYVYIRTDLSDAYNNRYSGKGDNPSVRVNVLERQLVYLENDCIVIFDTIESTHKKFNKKWLLHSGSFYSKSGKPELDGQMRVVAGNEGAGISESMDSNRVTITEENSALRVNTLIPESHLTRRIGGEGYEFWVDGKNWRFAQKQIPQHRRNEDPGAWRIEIEPREESENVDFLHVLHPYMRNQASHISIVEKANSISKNLAGASISDNRQNWAIFCDSRK